MSTRPITSVEEAALESLVDAHGLDGVLYALETICTEKADHVQINWQDEKLALLWITASNRINNARGEINEQCGPLP